MLIKQKKFFVTFFHTIYNENLNLSIKFKFVTRLGNEQLYYLVPYQGLWSHRNDLPARLKDSSMSKNSFRNLPKTFLFDR